MIVVHADTPWAVRRGASETRDDVDAMHISLLMDAVMKHATDDEAALKLRRDYAVPSALPAAAPTSDVADARVASVLDEIVAEKGIFVDALHNGEEAYVSMRTVLERQSATWQRLLHLPRCVKVSTNQTTVRMQAMLASVLSCTMGFADIPWRTDEYDLSFGQRAVILHYCVEPSKSTERVELEVSTEWIRHLSVPSGKAPARVTPYRTALNMRGCRPSVELLTCVTGFGKTLTAMMIGLMDACHPKLWGKLLVEFRQRVHEKRCIPKAGGIYEGNDPEAHRLARVILVVCDNHLIPQWREAAIHAARGMYLQLDDDSVRICIVQERFDLEVLASASPSYVFIVLARPTTYTSDALRAHPNIHIVSRFDDEMATNLTRGEAPEVRSRSSSSSSLGRRFRILESVAAKRHMCVNATVGSMAAVMRIPHHPLRELLAGYSGSCLTHELPTHKNLANAVVRGWSAETELHLEQFARLTFTVMPPELLEITVDDALAQMTPAFRVVRLRCSLATLDGRLHDSQENDMMSNDLVSVIKSVCEMPKAEFSHVVGPTLAALLSDTTTSSRIASVMRDLSTAIAESIRALDDVSTSLRRRSQAHTLSRLADRVDEAQEGAECAVCMDSLQAPAEAVVMMCCTNMLCRTCAESLRRCVFCRRENPTCSLNVHDIVARGEEEVEDANQAVGDLDERSLFGRLVVFNRRPRSLLTTCFAAIDEILAEKPCARILVGMKHRSANATDSMLKRFRDTYTAANVEDIESMSHDCDANTCAAKRDAFNDRIGHAVPFLWIIDSALTSSSLAGIDLPTTDVVVMTTQMEESAQWQLAGRAVRRTPVHKLPDGQTQPDEKMVVLLSTL